MDVGQRTFRVAQMGRCGEDQQSPRAASNGSLELEIESTPEGVCWMFVDVIVDSVDDIVDVIVCAGCL